MKLLLASQNENKKKEIEKILNPAIALISLRDLNFTVELPEPFSTLEENAQSKATFVFEKFRLPCFSEDTGLEVDALNGEPGVYSARYAGADKNSEDNIALVMKKMEHANNRRARFRTIVCLIINAEIKFFEGTVNGTISQKPSGASGFGYDPIFMADGRIKTFAEISSEEKNSISHRAIAIRKMNAFLTERLNKL